MDTRTQAKQYIDIGWRRRWWVVIPTVLGVAGSLYLYSTLPKRYRATTTILVTRQSVPEDIVRSTVTMRIDERMKTLKVQVLSRTYLERVAREIGLVEAGDDEAKVERACEQINESVNLDWDKRDLSWFRIMVTDQDPRRAAKVANRLAEMFIEQNTEFREAQAKGTVDTIDSWKDKTQKELEERDKEIADYKQRYLYELPDQQPATLQLMNASTTRVSQLSSDIQIRTDRLAILRTEEKANRAAAAALGVDAPGDDPSARALMQLELELQELLVSYTDENPLVRRKRDQIAQFKSTHPALAAAKAAGLDEPTASPEVQNLQAEIRRLEFDRAREQRIADDMRRRLENIPLRQQELTKMTRGYDTLKADFDRITGKRQEAERSLDIESAKKGEQFQIQDKARPPAVPFEPQIFQLLIMGLLGGLGVGAGLAALLEFLDQSVRGEDEFASQFPDVPILGSIPNLDAGAPPTTTFLERVTRKRIAGALLIAVLLVGVVA